MERSPLSKIVGSGIHVPADFPKKKVGRSPGGSGGMPPDASFPVPTRLASGKCGSICEGRGRPRMISTAFDPAFLSTRKGVARRSNLAITCQSFIRSCHKAHAVLWHLLSLCGERRQRRRIICRFSHHENRRQRYHLNHPIQIGAAAPGILVVIISSYILHPNQYSYFETNNM